MKSIRKFNVYDHVCIRHFSEIDTDDIGSVQYSKRGEGSCFNIDHDTIDGYADGDLVYMIIDFREKYNTVIYRVRDVMSKISNDWWWAQGMLMPAEEEELPVPETDGLFSFLYGVET